MERENENKIGSLLEEIIASSPLGQRFRILDVFDAWEHSVGEDIVRATTNRFFKDGILFCTISSSLVRSRLYFQLENIRAAMNRELKSETVKKIILK